MKWGEKTSIKIHSRLFILLRIKWGNQQIIGKKKELEKKEKNKNKREIPNSLDKCPEFKSVEKG